MRILLAIIVAVAGFFLVSRLFGRGKERAQETVTPRHFKRLASQLKQTGSDGAFWVVLVPNTAERDGAEANLQMSLEGGKLGMDWVINGARNQNDRDSVSSFFSKRDIACETRRINDTEYLRVEQVEDWPALASDLLAMLYEVKDSTELPLITDGFDWP